MLILSRKNQEAVVVGLANGRERLLTVTVLGIAGGRVTLGFDGPPELPVHRLEVWQRIHGEEQGPMTLAMPPQN